MKGALLIIGVFAILAIAQMPGQRVNTFSGKGAPGLPSGKCETDSVYFDVLTGRMYYCVNSNSWVIMNMMPAIGSVTLRVDGECAPSQTEVAVADRFIMATTKAKANVGTTGKMETKVASGLDLPFYRVILCKNN